MHTQLKKKIEPKLLMVLEWTEGESVTFISAASCELGVQLKRDDMQRAKILHWPSAVIRIFYGYDYDCESDTDAMSPTLTQPDQ